jgi:hypothetical protein
MKQETLEEVAERFIQESTYRNLTFEDYIKFGANWQAERMYSEEEVKRIIDLHSGFIDSGIDYEGISNATTPICTPDWDDDVWFEQFKKK